MRPTDGLADDPSRRRFLVTAAGVAVVATAGGAIGRLLVDRRSTVTHEVEAAIPPPTDPAPPIPAGAELNVPGITPLVMPNNRFYRIDTALITPSVDVKTWQLSVKGLVDRPTTLTFDELVKLPITQQWNDADRFRVIVRDGAIVVEVVE